MLLANFFITTFHLQQCICHTTKEYVSPLSPFIAQVKHFLVWDLWSVYCHNIISIASLHNGPSDSQLMVFTFLSNPFPHYVRIDLCNQ